MTLQLHPKDDEQEQERCPHEHIEDPWIDDYSHIHVTVTGFCADCGTPITNTIYPEQFDPVHTQ